MQGSSPLARGLPYTANKGKGPTGIIPARAGFTRHRPSVSHLCQDHPRSRGVYETVDQVTDDGEGIIPARAGFTRTYLKDFPWVADHPRSRGVYYDTDGCD